MAKQLVASPSTKKISELYTRTTGNSPTLILQPTFQRKFVWNIDHKEKFIETILKGLPIPEIYVAQSGIDIEKIETQEVVVDGQQRLSTIVQYIEEPEDSDIFGRLVSKYKALSQKEKEDFLNYTIVIRDLGDIDSETIKEIFSRINLTRYGLNDIEIQNAIYDGEFITTAKEILKRINIEELPVLSESDISRMEDLYFILSILTTIEHGGYFSRDNEIEKYVVKYNDKYPNKDSIKENVIRVFEIIVDLKLQVDSIWYRRSNFFTLVNELYPMIDQINISDLRNKLINLEENIISNRNLGKEDNDFSKYYSYMYSGTNSRKARVIRGELFKKYVFAQ